MLAMAESKKGTQNTRKKALVLSEGADIDWCRFEKSVYDQFGVNVVTLDKSGARMTSGDMLWANDLCALIKTSPNGADKICNRVLDILIQAVKAKRIYALDECDAGINKIVFPIIQNQEINGFVNICGKPFCNAERIYTDYIHETINVDTEEIKKLLPSICPINPRTLKDLKQFVTNYEN